MANYRHGGAERYEVLIDFRKYKTGQRIELRNLSNKNNVDYDYTNKIMAFDVTDEPVDTTDPTWNRIPTTLAGSEAMSLTASQSVKTRSDSGSSGTTPPTCGPSTMTAGRTSSPAATRRSSPTRR